MTTITLFQMAEPFVSTPLTFLRAYFVLIVLFLVILHFLRQRYLSPLRHISGPFLASCSRLWKVWAVATSHPELEYIELHKKYGPIVRVAPNEISVSHATAARQVLWTARDFRKNSFYTVFLPPESPDIFTEIRQDVHARKKRAAAGPYSFNSIHKLAGSIDSTIDLLFSKLDDFANKTNNSTKPFPQDSSPSSLPSLDLGVLLHHFAFDVLGQIAFSKKFGFLDSGSDIESTIEKINTMQQYKAIIGQVPFVEHWLRDWIYPVWEWIPWVSREMALPLPLRMAGDKIRERKQEGLDGGRTASGSDIGGREDLLQQFMQTSTENPHKFGEDDVFAVVTGAILAGADSTASTTQSFIHHILRSPSIHQTLFTEILTAHRSGLLSPHITWDQSQSLPYFQACLRETMRLRPAVGLPMTRRLPPQGAIIDGTHLPGNIVVGVNSWVVHRDRSVFGDDADTFRPERWLPSNSTEERVRWMGKHMFQFGGGSHLCIGRHLALLEMNKVLAMLIRDFEMELVHPEKDLEYQSFFFISQKGLDVRLRRRKLEEPEKKVVGGDGRGEVRTEEKDSQKIPWKQDIGNGRVRWKTNLFS